MKSFIALLLLSYIALAICQTPVAAPTSYGRARTLRVFKVPGAVGVKAVAVTKVGGMTDLDAIVAGASLLPFPTMGYSYFTSQSDATEDMTTITTGRFSFAFRIVGLVEYVESGANAGYQPDEDTYISYYSLRKELAGWDTTIDVDNGQTVRIATASSKDGVVNFTLAFSGGHAVFENRTLNGDNFKFSVSIDYSKAPMYSGRNDTSLAIITIAAAKKSVKDIQRTGQSGSIEVPSDDKGIVGQLAWDGQVTATHSGNNASFTLVSTVDSSLRNDSVALNVTTNWTVKVVYHSVSLDSSMSIGNTQLYWDPELGANIDYNSLGSASSASSIIASIAVVISALVAVLA